MYGARNEKVPEETVRSREKHRMDVQPRGPAIFGSRGFAL
jgi:hypothetical protein